MIIYSNDRLAGEKYHGEMGMREFKNQNIGGAGVAQKVGPSRKFNATPALELSGAGGS
jgi:hypothetical protein